MPQGEAMLMTAHIRKFIESFKFNCSFIAEADMFVSKITKCEVKLLYVSEGENQSPNISTQQIMEDMKFDCAQIHLTQRAVTSFQVSVTPAFSYKLFQHLCL